MTVTSVASPTTWPLVMMSPSLAMMTPEPLPPGMAKPPWPPKGIGAAGELEALGQLEAIRQELLEVIPVCGISAPSGSSKPSGSSRSWGCWSSGVSWPSGAGEASERAQTSPRPASKSVWMVTTDGVACSMTPMTVSSSPCAARVAAGAARAAVAPRASGGEGQQRARALRGGGKGWTHLDRLSSGRRPRHGVTRWGRTCVANGSRRRDLPVVPNEW